MDSSHSEAEWLELMRRADIDEQSIQRLLILLHPTPNDRVVKAKPAQMKTEGKRVQVG